VTIFIMLVTVKLLFRYVIMNIE